MSLVNHVKGYDIKEGMPSMMSTDGIGSHSLDKADSKITKNFKTFGDFIMGDFKIEVNSIKSISVPNTENLISINKEDKSEFTDNLIISILDKGGVWYNNIKINGKNNTKFRIKQINMTSLEIFKLNGIISTYVDYISYYNKMVDVVSNVPSVEQVHTIHNASVLTAIDTLRKDLEVLRDEIVNLSNYIKNIIKSAVFNKKIIIEEITFKYYLDVVFDHLRIGKKLPIDLKKPIEKL